jgi:tetratricopeptide (TPR) repeat protein
VSKLRHKKSRSTNSREKSRVRGKSGRWVAGICLIAFLGGGYFFWRQNAFPKPPVIELSGTDPAIINAVEKALTVVRSSPRSGEAWGRLGMVLSIHDILPQADFCFAQAERFEPREPRWPYLRGLARSGEDPAAALPSLQRAAEKCGDIPAPHLRFAELLIERGRFDEAEAEVRFVLQRDPHNARALLGLARVANARGQPEAGLQYVRQAIQYAPDVKASHVLLAAMEQRAGNLPAAEEALRRAGQLPEQHTWPDPFLIEINRLRTGLNAMADNAESWLQKGAVTNAVALMQQAVAQYPDQMRAWLVLGKASAHARDLPAAENALRRAVQLAPDSVAARTELGSALFARQKYAEAEASYREALRISPQLAEAWFNLGLCLMNQRETARAIDAFQNATRFKPDLTYAYVRWGQALGRLQRVPEAMEKLQHALRLDPMNADAQEMLEILSRTQKLSE